MELVVDLSTKEVTLRDSDDLKRFSVRAFPQMAGDGDRDDDLGALDAALGIQDAGTVDPGGDVIISAAVIRRLAEVAAATRGATLDVRWDAGFASMLDYAASKGWMTDDGALRAHVEWGN